MKVEALHGAPRDEAALEHLLARGWPSFISADAVAAEYLPRVRECFADLELLALEGDRYVGAGWAVPIEWDGHIESLPEGYSDSLRRSMEPTTARAANTLVVCAAQVDASVQGRGVAAELLRAFRRQAIAHGYENLIVPLRPTLKHRYPLTPIEEYAQWARPDGSPFDPWLRTHWRMGARVIGTAAVAGDDGNRRRMGAMDEHGVPCARRLHHPRRPRSASHRRRRRRHLRRAQYLGRASS